MTNPPRTTFKIFWQHDGARELEVVVDADLPAFGPLEKRVRGIPSIATSHGALRMLLEQAFGDQWSVGVFDAVGGVTAIHMAPLAKVGTQDAAQQRERDRG